MASFPSSWILDTPKAKHSPSATITSSFDSPLAHRAVRRSQANEEHGEQKAGSPSPATPPVALVMRPNATLPSSTPLPRLGHTAQASYRFSPDFPSAWLAPDNRQLTSAPLFTSADSSRPAASSYNSPSTGLFTFTPQFAPASQSVKRREEPNMVQGGSSSRLPGKEQPPATTTGTDVEDPDSSTDSRSRATDLTTIPATDANEISEVEDITKEAIFTEQAQEAFEFPSLGDEPHRVQTHTETYSDFTFPTCPRA